MTWAVGPTVMRKVHSLYSSRFRSKYFRGRKIFGDWDIRVEQVSIS